MNASLGDRGERMEPYAIGIRFRPSGAPPWSSSVRVELCAWSKDRKKTGRWLKTVKLFQTLSCTVSPPQAKYREHQLSELGKLLWSSNWAWDHLG